MNHIFKNYKIYILGYVPSQIDVESRKRFAEAEMALSRSGFRNIRNKVKVLEDKKLERLGSNKAIDVDLRIIAATKPDLLEEARAGRFREDLAYRLTVAELRLPPLRERREDIPLLFAHFTRAAAERLGRKAPELSGARLSELLSHDWPGNVRELANAAERQILGLAASQETAGQTGQSLAAQQEAFEAQCLRAALARHKGDIKAVLHELQLPRRTLNEKMQRHGLLREMFVE